MDKQKLIKEFEEICGYTMRQHEMQVLNDALALLKEQDNEIDTLKTLLLGYETGAIMIKQKGRSE